MFRNFYLLFLPVSCFQINFHSVIKNSATIKFFRNEVSFRFSTPELEKEDAGEENADGGAGGVGGVGGGVGDGGGVRSEVGQTFPGGDRGKSFERKVFSLAEADPKV